MKKYFFTCVLLLSMLQTVQSAQDGRRTPENQIRVALGNPPALQRPSYRILQRNIHMLPRQLFVTGNAVVVIPQQNPAINPFLPINELQNGQNHLAVDVNIIPDDDQNNVEQPVQRQLP